MENLSERAFGTNHFNIALFDLDAAELVMCSLHEIRDVELKHAQAANPYYVQQDADGRRRFCKMSSSGLSPSIPTSRRLTAAACSFVGIVSITKKSSATSLAMSGRSWSTAPTKAVPKNSGLPGARRTSVSWSVKVPGCISLTTLLLGTAYRSFDGETEARTPP
jgi:hypothetical protein